MKFTNQAELDAYIDEKAKAISEEKIEAAKKKDEAEVKTSTPAPAREVRIEVGKDLLADDPKGGFTHLAEFTNAVYRKGSKDILLPKLDAWVKAAGTGMLEGTDEYGGYLIPDGFVSNILQITEEEANFAPRCQQVPISGVTTLIPAIDDTTHASTFGGIRFYKVAEAGELTESRPTIGDIRLTLDKHAGLCYVTDEMLQDAPQVDAILSGRFGMALAWYKDGYILAGDGAGEPVGAISSKNNALISVTRNTTSHVSAEDISGMWARMHSPLKANSVWVLNSDVLPEFDGMMIGTNTPLYMPPGGLSAAPYGTIKGRPVIETEHASALGSAGDISLIAFSEYLWAEKSMGTATSIHIKFLNMQTAFRFAVRFDGQPWWLAARTPKNGSTKSPFVTLAA